MGACDICNGDDDSLSFTCNECSGTFCSTHRLPESHDCSALKTNLRGAWAEDDENEEAESEDTPIYQRFNDDDSHVDSTPTSSNPARRVLSKVVTVLNMVLGLLLSPLFGLWDAAKWVTRHPMVGVLGILVIAGGALGATGQLDGVLDEGEQIGTSPANATDKSLDESRIETLVHERINDERESRNYDTLTHDADLRAIASSYSGHMADKDFFSHTSPSGETFEDRYEQAGYSCRVPLSGNEYATGGENIAYTYAFTPVSQPWGETVTYESEEGIADGIVRQWMNSQGHRENILESHWENEGVGVAVVENPDGDGLKVYVTQNFC